MSKAPIQRQAGTCLSRSFQPVVYSSYLSLLTLDKLAGVFVPLIVCISVFTFIFWLILLGSGAKNPPEGSGNLHYAIQVGTPLLVDIRLKSQAV